MSILRKQHYELTRTKRYHYQVTSQRLTILRRIISTQPHTRPVCHTNILASLQYQMKIKKHPMRLSQPITTWFYLIHLWQHIHPLAEIDTTRRIKTQVCHIKTLHRLQHHRRNTMPPKIRHVIQYHTSGTLPPNDNTIQHIRLTHTQGKKEGKGDTFFQAHQRSRLAECRTAIGRLHLELTSAKRQTRPRTVIVS